MFPVAASTSQPEPSAMPVASKLDRPKTTTACYNCRQRKLRCDGSKPACSNCLLYKTDCSYAQGRNKSGPPRGSKRQPKVDAERLERNKRSRRSSSSSPARSPPSSSDVSSSSATSPPPSSSTSARSASPMESSSGVIPSLIGPLSSDWCTEWGAVSWSDQLVQSSGNMNIDDFATTWSFPSTSDDIGLGANSLIMTDFLSPSTTTFLAVEDPTDPSNPPIASGSSLPLCQVSNPPSSHSPISHDFSLPQNGPAASALLQMDDAQSNRYSLDLEQQAQPPDLHAFRLIHAFVPIFPFRELAHIISDCEARKGHSIHAAFFLSAFHSLSIVASAGLSSSPPPHQPGCYAAAQQQSMQAYFALIPNDSTVVGHDICYTAAGLLYLAVRAVFTHGWGKEMSTWLRLAVDIVDRIPLTSPRELGLRCWIARIVWLWDKALTCCEPDLPSVLLNTSGSLVSVMRNGAPLSALEFDEDQRTVSGLVELCMDLEGLIALNTGCPLAKGSADFGQYVGLPGFAVLPLCQRVQAWVKSSPITQEFFLNFGMEPKCDDEVRDSIGRVLHLVYYGMAIKFNHTDRVQCSLKKSSLVVALARLVDAADWIVTTRRMCLWPFAERALLLARDNLLVQTGFSGQIPLSATQNAYWSLPSPPSTVAGTPVEASFEPLSPHARMMLSLIKDVFTEAHCMLDPATASAQRTSAAQAIESISALLDQQENSKPKLDSMLPTDYSGSEAMLAGLGQFFAGMPPHLLSLPGSRKC